MGVENLESLFKPTSITVIGATNEPGDVGLTVIRHLMAGSFLGPVMPVHPAQEDIGGLQSYRHVDTLPLTPDLAIICSPPHEVPEYLRQLGSRGTRGVVVLSQEFRSLPEAEARVLRERMLDQAKAYGLRILGPASHGLIIPGAGINASLAATDAKPGRIAFITQSNSLFTTILDWARPRNIGFSHFVALGERYDVTYGDLLDYLVSDPSAKSIVLYLESTCNARNFMSAARAAARNKPILVVKPRHTPESLRAETITADGTLNPDDVYDEAFRRAGMLRVSEIDTLFDAVETLARSQPVRGDRLAILTNGSGPGYLAADTLLAGDGRLARLSDETMAELEPALGPGGSSANPVVLGLAARPERYAEALATLLKDKGVDAILVIRVPTSAVAGEDTAEAVIDLLKGKKRVVITSWLGADDATNARKLFADAGIPTYDTPDKGVRAFLHLVNFRRNQELLMEMPASLPTDFTPDASAAGDVIFAALRSGRTLLNEMEAMDVLAAYGVPVAPTRIARTPEEAESMAWDVGFPVAMKILAEGVIRKSDVGGVSLDLESPEEVRAAFESMSARLARLQPGAVLQGFMVQRMEHRPGAHELHVGAATDPDFGPVIRFGQGGIAADIIADRAVALPPLNMSLARELISRTRVHRVLKGYREQPAADISAICLTLIQVSQLVSDIPEIQEIEINPLLADAGGALALDARIRVADATGQDPIARLAIRPYPRELEESGELKDGRRVTLRPIRPEDEPAHYEFFSHLSPEDIRFRFFGILRDLSHQEMARLTQIDYDREMAFIATAPDAQGNNETLGVVRAMTKPDNSSAEFAIIARSDMKGQGLGTLLMAKIIRYLKSRGTPLLTGQALPDNQGMQALARKMGFHLRKDYDENVVEMELPLS